MKQVFYKGLLALTIAFGVTSCDKNELDDIAAPTVGVVENDEYSKVSFGESGFGIQIPKLKGSTEEASKTAGEFDHIYSPTQQKLVISNAVGPQYTGLYTAGDISDISPSDIILANADGYTATSSNASNGSTDVVSSFLPYTSTVGFDLSASASIQLQASLLRGFVIVNVEDALEGSRVTGASVDGVALLDGGEGDYYGYLLAGPHSFTATYTLNDVATVVTASQEVAIGVAYTVTLDLVGEDPAVEGSTTSTETFNAIESELGQSDAGNDVNSDGDFLDSVRRIVTTIQPTLDGEPVGEADVMTPAWTVISDVDITTDTEESTEAAIVENINPGTDVGQDSDMYDTISRILTITTVYDVDGTEVSSDSVPGVWTILEDRSNVMVDEDGTGTTTNTITYDVREYSAWSPLTAAADVATIDQTRTHTNVDGSFDPAIAIGLLERNIENPDYLADVTDIFVYTDFSGEASNIPASRIVSGTSGSVDEVVGNEVEYFTRTITTPRENVVDAYSYIQTRTVSVQVNVREDSPALLIADAPLALTQTVEVAESRTDAADDVQTEEVLNPNYMAVSADLTRSDFSEDASSLVWTAASGEQFRLAFTTTPSRGYTFQIFANGAYGSVSSVYGGGADDDANYYAAVDAAIAAINAAN